jgi:hypothetical protein
MDASGAGDDVVDKEEGRAAVVMVVVLQYLHPPPSTLRRCSLTMFLLEELAIYAERDSTSSSAAAIASCALPSACAPVPADVDNDQCRQQLATQEVSGLPPTIKMFTKRVSLVTNN